jgi:GABA permease
MDMRTPVRSETDAFRIAYGTALLIGVSILVGLATEPVFGAVLFTAAALAAFVWDLRTPDKERRLPLREAAEGPHEMGTTGVWRILVVANETLAGAQLQAAIMRRAKLRPELVVIAPILPSRAHLVTTDIDHEMKEAQQRLDATLTWAVQQGFNAWGEVGNTHPVTAVEDALRRFGVDEVIISTHPPGRSNWLEQGIVERVREELDIPVTHVVVDRSAERAEIVA